MGKLGWDGIINIVVILLLLLLIAGLIIKLKMQVHQEVLKTHRTETLWSTSHKLRSAMGMEEILETGARQVMELLDRSVVFYDTTGGMQATPKLLYCKEDSKGGSEEGLQILVSENEKSIATWVFHTKHHAGRMSDTLPGAIGYYVPVFSEGRVFSVYGIALKEEENISSFDKNMLKALINETAFAAENYVLLNEQKRTLIDTERERFRVNLLRAVSHDLRTPLCSITGYSSVLLENEYDLDEDTKHDIYIQLYDESLWLNNLIENILAVTRLKTKEGGPDLDNQYLSELVQEALRHNGQYKKQKEITVEIPEGCMVQGDAHLISRVMINMIENTIHYTQKDSVIHILARDMGDKVAVEVSDDGPGIADSDKARVFDSHFEAPNNTGDNRRGLGLGLSLCKTIIDAHGGTIYVKDNHPQGTIFGFTLKKKS